MINLVSKQSFKLADVCSFAWVDFFNKVELRHPFIYLWHILISVLTSTLFASSGFAQAVTTASVCFDNQSNFNSPTIYYWNPLPNAGALAAVNWPGVAMQQTGTFYCHEFGADFDSLNVVFSDSGAQQTDNLELLGNNRCRANNQWQTHSACGLSTDAAYDSFTTVYFKNDANYANPRIHFFDLVPSTPDSNWPGEPLSALGDDWYSFEFQSPVVSAGVVFSDNGAAQTIDFQLDSTAPCYENGELVSLEQCGYNPNPELEYADTKALYFVNSPDWATPTAYIWNVTPVGSIANSNWPGVALESVGVNDLFFIELGDDPEQGKVIFSNSGANQTLDLDFTQASLCYNNGSWLTLEQCGVPTQNTLEVGGDRKVNRGSKIALTLPENDLPGEVTWQSDAWSGALIGESVVTPVVSTVGDFIVTVSVGSVSNQFTLEVVSSINALPDRPQLAKPLNFPTTGNVASGNYEFEIAFPNLAGKFESPVQVLNDGVNDLIYVVDKPGIIWVYPNDTNVEESQVVELLNIINEVRNNHEQGFISMAFHPQFAQNGFAYIYYIEGENDEPSSGGRFGDGVLQRITLNDTNSPTVIVSGSRVDVLRVPQVGNNHKGGKMEFHPASGLFYMSFGDGAYASTAGDPVDPSDPRKNNSAQETDNLLGTFIRVEMLNTPENNLYYRVPNDNPYVGNTAFRDEIWSFGHRNPWRWSFQTTFPYTLWQTEVGQAGFEEVNIIEPGKNYGWPICEGVNHRGQAGGDAQMNRSCTGDLEGPVEGYSHDTGSVSIIGGVVYNGNALPALRGKFLFGDYISKNIWTIEEGQSKTLLSDGFPSNILSFGSDLSGDQVLVSTVSFESGASDVYRIVDRDAVAAVIPDKLSQTGIFASLEEQFPVAGVIEYQVNSKPWFDGAQQRFFLSVPNEQKITFAQEDLWSLPVGSVLIKHSDIKVSENDFKPFETSVLFRQEGGWEAANYRWNNAGNDADLVTSTSAESVTEFVGGISREVSRSVRAGSECGSCHTGLDSKDPRGLRTQQLNRTFTRQGVSANQLDSFNGINLFEEGIFSAANYASYVDPADTNADLNERARVYLDTNCSSCHSGSLMDLNYDTALKDMDIMNRRLAGNQYRMLPFQHARSVLHSFQVSGTNRMPRGTSTTNPVADELFEQWIDANNAAVTSHEIKALINEQDISVGVVFQLQAIRHYNNGFEEQEFGTNTVVSWASSNANVIDVTNQNDGLISVTPLAAGNVTITVTIEGISSIRTILVTGGVPTPSNFVASALSSSSVSLNWSVDNQSNETIDGFLIKRATNVAGPFADVANVSAGQSDFVDTGLASSTRYYYRVRATNANGTSAFVSALVDTLAPTTVDSLVIETGNDFQLLQDEARQLIALVSRSGEVEGVTLSAGWSSSNSNVVNVSNGGVVSGGNQAGTATITASFGGESGSVQLVNQGAGTYLYFNNESTNWPQVRAYVFATSNGNETAQAGAWPGTIMQPSIEYGGKWMRLALATNTFGQQQTEVVFNCGSADCKSGDLQIDTAVPAQWYSAGQWLTAEPNGGGATSSGTQLIINNGEIVWANNGSNLTSRLITPGALVDLNASEVGIGQSFKDRNLGGLPPSKTIALENPGWPEANQIGLKLSRLRPSSRFEGFFLTQWEGSAEPYILNPSSPNTKMLVPAALSLTMNGVFDSIVDDFASGRDYYRSAEAGCTGCHGVDGQGSPPITNLNNKYTLAELSSYIGANMPLGNTSACEGECASEIAKMLLAEAFSPPAGVCDFNDLDDMVPADRSNRLLTLYEYNNSVRDILNLSADVDVTSANLPATIPINGFKTAADTVFTDEYAQGYVNAAAAVSDLINDDLFALAPACNNNLNCAIESAGKRIFRRPLSSVEVNELLSVHSEGGERAVIITLFSSPVMLYRSEVGEQITSGSQQGYYQLSNYEIASMLSYTFWGTTPDAWLMGIADSNGLSTPEQIRSVIEQMLSDTRAEIAFERFVAGWMELEKEIGSPALSDELKADMKEETMRFVKAIFFNRIA